MLLLHGYNVSVFVKTVGKVRIPLYIYYWYIIIVDGGVPLECIISRSVYNILPPSFILYKWGGQNTGSTIYTQVAIECIFCFKTIETTLFLDDILNLVCIFHRASPFKILLFLDGDNIFKHPSVFLSIAASSTLKRCSSSLSLSGALSLTFILFSCAVTLFSIFIHFSL